MWPNVVLPAQIEERLDFARAAADHFIANPTHWTYTAGEIEPGCLFAVRWGVKPADAHAVLVFRLADEKPEIYGDMDHDRVARHGATA